MIWLLAFSLFVLCQSINPFYLPCDNIQAQQEYFERERKLFAIGDAKQPFNLTNIIPDHEPYFPMTCKNDDGTYRKPKLSHVEYLCNHTNLALKYPLNRFTMLDDTFNWAINQVWKLTSWQRVHLFGEDYMFYQNTNTNDTVFFLHGINVMNGLENLYLLNDITKRANVYILIYHPILFFDRTPYTHTYDETIDNLHTMMRNTVTSAQYQIIANSFGTIQITTLCKRYPSLCLQMTDIILTDPVLVNYPFSKTSDIVTYGVFMNHPLYDIHNFITDKLRIKKYYDIVHTQADWYEWSIDSLFIRTFTKQLVLVIGKYDSLIDGKHSPILDECRVIYTETVHGMVLFDNFMESLTTRRCDV
jgi:hypothetical protein